MAILAGCAAAALWTAPAAVGCELTGLSAQGPGGATVHPGDTVAYSLYARTTDSSPQDSSYTINIDSHGGLASGYADPSANGGESTGTFIMPDLGGGAMAVTVSAIADNGGYVATTLRYVGATAAQASTQPPAPAADTEPGGGDQVQQAVPAVAPAPHASMPHAQPSHRTLTFRPPARRSLPGHAQRAAASAPLATPATAPAPAIVAHPTVRHLTRFARQRRPARATRRASDRVAPVAVVVPSPPAARTHGLPRELLLALALLALAAGGGGACAMARRRSPRSPLAAAAIDADGAIEAELQEILAEERARTVSAEHAGTPP